MLNCPSVVTQPMHTLEFTINNLSLSKKSTLKNLTELNAKFRVIQKVVTSYMDILSPVTKFSEANS